jgi:transposase-like protein
LTRHYPPDSKAEALQILLSNGGDIAAVHYRTGIPYRTLYTWWQEMQQPSLPKKETPLFEDSIDKLLDLRQLIIHVLLKLNATPTPQANNLLIDHVRAQTGLLDCLLKLNAHLGPHLTSAQPLSYWDQAGNEYEPI